MYRTIELNSVYPTSGKLVLLLTDIRNFDVILKNIYSTVHNGGTDYGKVTVSFVTNDGTTFQTQDFNLTGTAQDFDMHYLYTTTLPLAAKVEMVFSASNTGDDKTKIYWDGGIELYKEKFVISPTPNEMYWRGWVQPDQLSRKFMTDQYFISMIATDGLADLKQTDFPFDYSMTTGQTSIAYLLKKSLEPIGLPLPIKSQLNIKEAHLSTGQTVLGNIYANPLKFISFKSGKVKYENSYEAIEMVLDAFNAKLFQSGGYYHIVQQNEINSKQTTYNWNNLTASTISYTRQFNDINKVLFGSDELSKVRPLKRIEYTFPDLNAGSYVPQYLFNGRFDYNVIGWETYIFPAAIEWDSGSTSMKYTMNWALASGEADSQFRVRGLGMNILPDQGSTVTINWDTLLSNVTFFSGDQIPRLTVELWGFNGEESAGDTLMDSITVDVVSGKTKTNFVNLKYKDNDTTVYYCVFYFVQQSPIHLLTAYFDNFQAFKNNDSNLTEHVLYTGELNTTSIDLLEGEVNFGNSDSFNDAGALLYSPSGLTTTWSNYGGSENLTLQSLLIKNRLTLFNKFKNYVRITVKTDSIRFNHILNMKGKLYAITAYSFDLMGNNLQLEVVEYLNTSPLTIAYTSEKLSGNGSE